MKTKTALLRMREILLWIFVIIFCLILSGCAGQPIRHDSPPAANIPLARGWVIHQTEGLNVIAGRYTPEGMRHTILASAGLQAVRTTIEEPGPTRRGIRNNEELLQFFTEQGAKRFEGVRCTNPDFRASAVRYLGQDCVKLDCLCEDRQVPGYGGRAFILTAKEYFCLHPAATQSHPVAVHLHVSQRYLQGKRPFTLDDEVEPFFRHYLEGSSSPLLRAAKTDDAEGIGRLIREGADVNMKSAAVSDWGKTALMEASLRGYNDIVAPLLRAGADIDATDIYGDTALIFASGKGHLETVKLLLANRAAVNARSTYTKSTALMCAAVNGYEAIVRLLLDAGADPNGGNEGAPLLLAAWRGAGSTMEVLIARGADVNARNEMGMTPLMYAAADGRAIIVKRLIERGADVNARNILGETPLAMARWRKQAEIIEILSGLGAKE